MFSISNGLRAFISAVTIIATFNFHPHGQNDMEIVGDIAWIARSTYGALVSVDMSDPGSPTTLGVEPVTVMDETFNVVTARTHT